KVVWTTLHADPGFATGTEAPVPSTVAVLLAPTIVLRYCSGMPRPLPSPGAPYLKMPPLMLDWKKVDASDVVMTVPDWVNCVVPPTISLRVASEPILQLLKTEAKLKLPVAKEVRVASKTRLVCQDDHSPAGNPVLASIIRVRAFA